MPCHCPEPKGRDIGLAAADIAVVSDLRIRTGFEIKLGSKIDRLALERFSVDVNRNNKGVPKGAQIRFGLP